MNEVLELSIRATIQYLAGNMSKFNEYKNKALEIHEEIEGDKIYRYPIRNLLPKETKQKLYELIN